MGKTGKILQWAKDPATQLDHLTLVCGTHVVKEGN